MTDEQRVKEVYPDAFAQFWIGYYWISNGESLAAKDTLSGDFGSESEAWADAASRLPKAGSVPDDCLDITDDGKVIIAALPVAEPAPQTFEEWWEAYNPKFDTWEGLARAAWNAAKASSPALLVREEIARDNAIIQDTVNRGAFFLDWRLASLAAKKGHRGLMTTTAGDFVVLTDKQELELRQAASAVTSSSPVVAGGESETRKIRQKSIGDWAIAAFGEAEALSLSQRGLRLMEEAAEAAQSTGVTEAQAHHLVGYVWSRSVGSLPQELGGVGVTILALAQAAGLDADRCEITEVERVLSKPLEHFSKRNKEKNDAGLLAQVPSPEKCPNCGRNDGWHRAEGHPPPPNGDSRKIVWMSDRDGMEWWGVRAYGYISSDGYDAEYGWVSNGVKESSTVLFWRDGPHSPHYPLIKDVRGKE